jgi:FG-GAP repeat
MFDAIVGRKNRMQNQTTVCKRRRRRRRDLTPAMERLEDRRMLTVLFETAHITAPDAAAGDHFGYAVDLSGNTAIIGARFEDGAGDNRGAAYVYDYSTPATPTLTAKLEASDAEDNDRFGEDVAVSGNLAIVGAVDHNDASAPGGAVYIFDIAGVSGGGIITETFELVGGVGADDFGFSVGISGNLAVIGEPGRNANAIDDGVAYVYDLSSAGAPVLVTTLLASDPGSSDRFGSSVAISGTNVIVGAFRQEDAGLPSLANRGAAYVFDLSGPITPTMTEDFKLTASDAADGDEFGFAVDISSNRAIVGTAGKGSAYVFDLSGAAPVEYGQLTTSDAASGIRFGDSVGISNNVAIVGDRFSGGNGAAYLFDLTGAVPVETDELNPGDGGPFFDEFGYDVVIDSGTALVAARRDDLPGLTQAGSAYLFELTPSAPVDFVVTPTTTQAGLDGLIVLTGSFSAQDVINALDINLPNFTFVGEDFFVINTDTAIIAAPQLDEVGGNMSVDGNTSAAGIDLAALGSVGGNMSVDGNTSAAGIDLGALDSVGGDFTFVGNFAVLQIDLSALTHVGGDMIADGNTSASTMDLGALVSVGGDMSADGNTSASTMDLGALASVGGDMSVSGNTSSTSVDMGGLGRVGGDMTVTGNTSSTSVDMGGLESVGGDMTVTANTSSTTIDVGGLETVGGDMDVSDNVSSTTIDVGGLTDVGGDMTVDSNTSLTDLSLDALFNVFGDFTLLGNVSLSLVNAVSLASVGGDVTLGDTILNLVSNDVQVDGDVTLMEGGGVFVEGESTLMATEIRLKKNAALKTRDKSKVVAARDVVIEQASLVEVEGESTLMATEIQLKKNAALRIKDKSKAVAAKDVVIEEASVVAIDETSTLMAMNVDVMTGGAIQGEGTIEAEMVNNKSGTVSPGMSPGSLTFVGVYRHQADAVLVIELSGTTAGSQYDVLIVDGSTILEGGTLDVVLLDSFAPQLGDSFDFLTTQTLTGTFDAVTLPEGFLWDIDYSSPGVTLTVTGVSDPGFSYVDADNDGYLTTFGGDVALTAGEVGDGRFDTNITEGGYTTVIAGAGLVVNGVPVIAQSITYRADGNLVVNTNLTATAAEGSHNQDDDDDERDDGEHYRPGSIRLTSRDGAVLLGESQLTASNNIRIRAEVDIISSDGLLRALGDESNIDLKAVRDVALTGTTVRAVRTVRIEAHQSITIGDSASNDGLIHATDRAHGKVKLTTSHGDITANGATIEAGRKVKLNADHGDITAMDAVFLTIGDRKGKVELKADNIDIRSSRLEANRKVSLKARSMVFADDAFLVALLHGGEVDVKARHDINLNRATLRAFKEIKVHSQHGDVGLTEADLAIITGSRKGDIDVRGVTIDITDASILAPDKIKLKGSVLGTPAVLGKGTKDVP